MGPGMGRDERDVDGMDGDGRHGSLPQRNQTKVTSHQYTLTKKEE